jgi:hypothetical protein
MFCIPTRSAASHVPARHIAVAAILGAAILAAPLSQALAASAGAADTTGASGETVDQRITALHASLVITPAEESKWNNVAQAMRENESAMRKLAAEKVAVAPQNMSAVDDLNSYEKFAQAHVDGLKNLIASFDELYGAMPDSQKKIADQVFQSFGRKGAAHS